MLLNVFKTEKTYNTDKIQIQTLKLSSKILQSTVYLKFFKYL